MFNSDRPTKLADIYRNVNPFSEFSFEFSESRTRWRKRVRASRVITNCLKALQKRGKKKKGNCKKNFSLPLSTVENVDIYNVQRGKKQIFLFFFFLLQISLYVIIYLRYTIRCKNSNTITGVRRLCAYIYKNMRNFVMNKRLRLGRDVAATTGGGTCNAYTNGSAFKKLVLKTKQKNEFIRSDLIK